MLLLQTGRGLVWGALMGSVSICTPSMVHRRSEGLPALALQLTPIQALLNVGEPVTFAFTIENMSDAPALVLRPTAHSHFSVRFPEYRIEIVDENGTREEIRSEVWQSDHDRGRLTRADFEQLEPGERSRPLPLRGWVPRSPGRYTVTAIYDSRATRGDATDPETRRVLDSSPRGIWRSPPITTSAGQCKQPLPPLGWKQWTAIESRLHFDLFDLGYRNICVSVQAPEDYATPRTFVVLEGIRAYSSDENMGVIVEKILEVVPDADRYSVEVSMRW